MGTYLNPGNYEFRGLIEDDIYVDKTGLLSYTNGRIGKAKRHICVSHPRRFGKSAAADMLTAYYSRGCDSRALFENLKIAQDPSFETHLNKYDVLHINVKNFMSAKKTVSDGMELMTKEVSAELKEYAPDVEFTTEEIPFMLNRIYNRTGIPFVVIIDEWDCPLREKNTDDDRKEDPKGLAVYLDFICNLLKGKTYVALCYMTGILPMRMNGTQSEANMFDEYSMTNFGLVGEYFGFTEDEVKELSEKHEIPFEDLKEWYDGYDVGGVSMYNPNSVTTALMHNELDSYWTDTEEYEDLRRYVTMDRFGLKAKVLFLLSGEEVPVNTRKFKRDLGRLDSADEVLTALIHLGYLTYSRERGTARIPNHEIRLEFEDAMEDTDEWCDVIADVRKSYELLRSLLRGEAEAVAEGMYEAHESSASVIEYNDENSLACTIRIALNAAIKDYVFIRELPAGKGFADVVLVPKEWKAVPPVIVELKYGDSAKGAIAQIKERRYADRFKGLKRDIYLVGINYDEKSKVHECLIEVMKNA